jgi:acyl-CoA dehydrogenase
MALQTADLNDVLSGLDNLLEAEVFPLHAKHREVLENPRGRHDESGRFSDKALALIRQVRAASANAGFYTLTVPPPVGTTDVGWEGMFLLWEHVFRRCGTRNWLGHHVLAHWTKGPNPLLARVSPDVRDRYLPDLQAGLTSMCFAMSEPEAGSDAWGMRSRARRVEGGWQLNARKQWISNGSHADLCIVFAVTDSELAQAKKGGIGAFLVPTTSPGFEAIGVTPMFGHVGSNEALLNLDDVFVPDDHVIGDPLDGFGLAMHGVALGRVYNCAKAVGLAQWALQIAVEHARIRTAFGNPLSSYQGLSFRLAEQAMQTRAARLVSLDSVRRMDAGHEGRREMAEAKILATESAVRSIDVAMQVLGAMGFTNEVGLSEAWQMVRVVCVADGSAEILRNQIAKDLFRHGVRA